jgi:hypothetical protein
MTYQECTTKKARIEFLREKLGSNYNWATRGLVRIFEAQTADEQSAGTTKYHNGVGFTGADSYILSSFAKQVNKGWTLKGKQLPILFKKMPRYARQLDAVAQVKV